MHSELLLVSTTLALRIYFIMNGVNMVRNIYFFSVISCSSSFPSFIKQGLVLLRGTTRAACRLLPWVGTPLLSGRGILLSDEVVMR